VGFGVGGGSTGRGPHQLRAELLRLHRELDDHLEHVEDELRVVRLCAQHGDEVRLQRAPQPESAMRGHREGVVTPHVPLKVAHALLDALAHPVLGAASLDLLRHAHARDEEEELLLVVLGQVGWRSHGRHAWCGIPPDPALRRPLRATIDAPSLW
tara:strand:- start:22 stop:486 length:465 start_codon:yes stop_codon:yes gene_type:complete